MNTKVVPSNILNMFEAFLRLHNHFIHWSHVNPRSNQAYHHLGAQLGEVIHVNIAPIGILSVDKVF